jgi:DNA (cytosine-5)-methyltransferase 1
MPQFQYGFRGNPAITRELSAALTGGKVPNAVSAVSMFAGCGGLDLGVIGGFRFHGKYYAPLPFDIVAAYDNDNNAVEAYKLNLTDHIRLQDLTDLPSKNLPAADVLFGGFPCQDFSSCGHKRGFDGERGRLYRVMVDYMRAHKPKIVIGENVPLLAGMKGGTLLDTIVAELEAVGYRVKCWLINCPDYGLPASRKRIFIVCVRDDLTGFPKQPQPTHTFRHLSIDEALGDLEQVTDETVANQSQYFVATRATAGAGQGDQTCVPGQVAYAVRANSKARVHFHYKLDRRLTVRECARLQSFPDEFIFPFATQNNVMLIGNAVPPIVAHHVGSAVAEYLVATVDRGALQLAS